MKQIIKTIFLSSVTIFITISLIKFPDQSLEASIRGLDIWLKVVFPSLLPFFITAELLIAFGIVKFIGVLSEPIMRPLFNVPGVGSFAWVMGMASGYPSGAKISARLREEKQVSQIEGERLLSFTNAASPLFIFAAVSVGFFHDVKLGLLIAVCHYLGNTLVGICMRFHGRGREATDKTKHKTKNRLSIRRAFKEMHEIRVNDPRPLGEIMGDAVLNSIQTLVIVGGFIILFSVLTKLLSSIGISTSITHLLQYGLALLSLPIEMGLPLLTGLFEITLGIQMISNLSTDSLLAKMVVVSFILGFNGFSIQAQVSSIIAKTDIRFAPYFISRILHGVFASILTIVLFKPLYLNKTIEKVDGMPVIKEEQHNYWVDILNILKQIGPLLTMAFICIAILIMYKRKFHNQ